MIVTFPGCLHLCFGILSVELICLIFMEKKKIYFKISHHMKYHLKFPSKCNYTWLRPMGLQDFIHCTCCLLTLVLLNLDIHCLRKQCIQYVNLYQQSGSSNLIG